MTTASKRAGGSFLSTGSNHSSAENGQTNEKAKH